MSNRKEYVGTVVSDKMDKTIIVQIARMSKDSKYNRTIKRYNKFKVHDENKSAKVGDTVEIQETRPLSKDKHFRLIEVVKKAAAVHVEVKEEAV